MSAADAQLEKINGLRTRVTELSAEKERLAGSISTQEQSLGEIEKECRDKFACGVDELSALAEKLESEAQALVTEAETILAGDTEEESVGG